MSNWKKMETNNYPNWLVPFKVAEELKYLDFREPTFTYYEFDYSSKDGGRYFTPIDINFDSLKIYNRYKAYVSIPTYEQVFEWFRSKKFYSIIDYCGDKHYSFRILKMGTLSFETNNKVYSTYEQAREALVEKLIEIYKRNENENSI